MRAQVVALSPSEAGVDNDFVARLLKPARAAALHPRSQAYIHCILDETRNALRHQIGRNLDYRFGKCQLRKPKLMAKALKIEGSRSLKRAAFITAFASSSRRRL